MDLSILNTIDTNTLRRAELMQRAKPFTIYYPDDGLLARHYYQKALEFFEAGNKHKLRLVIAGNRTGKSEGIGGYETALHLTGRYPDWWTGKRFNKPVSWVCASHTGTTTRDICQYKLLGDPSSEGAGLIPIDCLDYNRSGKVGTSKMGVPDAYDTIRVKHVSGGWSVCRFLAFEQGRKKFEGTERDGVWLDEEPPLDVMTECLVRTMTTQGILIITFTPLQGMSETVQYCLENNIEKGGTVFVTSITWDDVPHLSEQEKDELLKTIPPYQRDARSKGIPALGSGAIYPIEESFIFIEPIPIPKHYKHAYGLDVGWNKTACVWGAIDPDTGVTYVYSEHYRGEAESAVHTEAIKSRGDWIRGVIDPASRGRSQVDGESLMMQYRQKGLHLVPADNAVEAGLWTVFDAMVNGKLKIFTNCVNLQKEFRLYRRDEKGKVVKKDDHAMDALRYLMVTGRNIAEPQYKRTETTFRLEGRNRGY